jgi:SAM-dependent methyltransferase
MVQPVPEADPRTHFENLYTKADPWSYEGTDADIARTNAIVKRLQYARFEQGLDLGCGAGRLTNALSGFTKRMVGIDIAEKAIGRARTRYSHIQFAQGDLIEFLERTEEDHAAYDFVSISEVLYYYQRTEDRRRALARLAAIGVPTCLYYFAAIVQQGDGPRRYFGIDELTAMVSERFAIIDCFPSVVEMPRFLDLLGRYTLRRTGRVKLREMYAATREPNQCQAVGLLAVKREANPSYRTSISIVPGAADAPARAQPRPADGPMPRPSTVA